MSAESFRGTAPDPLKFISNFDKTQPNGTPVTGAPLREPRIHSGIPRCLHNEWNVICLLYQRHAYSCCNETKWMDSSGDSCIIQQEPRWITCACVQASHWFAAPECSPESGTMRWWPWVTSYLVCSQWSYSLSGCYSITQENLKGIVHAEMKSWHYLLNLMLFQTWILRFFFL